MSWNVYTALPLNTSITVRTQWRLQSCFCFNYRKEIFLIDLESPGLVVDGCSHWCSTVSIVSVINQRCHQNHLQSSSLEVWVRIYSWPARPGEARELLQFYMKQLSRLINLLLQAWLDIISTSYIESKEKYISQFEWNYFQCEMFVIYCWSKYDNCVFCCLLPSWFNLRQPEVAPADFLHSFKIFLIIPNVLQD